MAQIKANIKAKKQSDKRHVANKNKIDHLKATIKANKDLKQIYKEADCLACKGVIHKNKANRIKSRRARAMNKAAANKK